jgi:hypothetical protein
MLLHVVPKPLVGKVDLEVTAGLVQCLLRLHVACRAFPGERARSRARLCTMTGLFRTFFTSVRPPPGTARHFLSVFGFYSARIQKALAGVGKIRRDVQSSHTKGMKDRDARGALCGCIFPVGELSSK